MSARHPIHQISKIYVAASAKFRNRHSAICILIHVATVFVSMLNMVSNVNVTKVSNYLQTEPSASTSTNAIQNVSTEIVSTCPAVLLVNVPVDTTTISPKELVTTMTNVSVNHVLMEGAEISMVVSNVNVTKVSNSGPFSN